MGPEHHRAARIICLTQGTSHLIGTLPLTVGRDPVSDIQLDEEDVSRRHAYLLRTPQGFLLVDSSTHGTWVNGDRIQAQRLLADRDVIQVGSRRFQLRGVWRRGAGARPRTDAPRAPGDERVFPHQDRRSTHGQAGSAAGTSSRPVMEDAIRELDQALRILRGRRHHHRHGYGLVQMARTWRGLFIEFGPSELFDAALVRPLAMGVGTRVLGWGWGILAGKIAADLLFYIPVIWIHERRQRVA